MAQWIEDFNQVVGGVTGVLKELQPILGEPQTTIPKQAAATDAKLATAIQPDYQPAAPLPSWVLLVAAGIVAWALLG